MNFPSRECNFAFAQVINFFSELQEDHSMEMMMRSKDMSVYDRITSFYSAPFTKFMGTVVSRNLDILHSTPLKFILDFVLIYLMLQLQVSYIAFILLYGYVITMYFPRFDSSQTLGGLSVVELILYFWILTIILEEIRQVRDLMTSQNDVI